MGSRERPAVWWPAGCHRMVAAAGVVLLAGCTMCPDPYDYTGPVPNGSSPQNNFRARSNGILPIGAAPVPWPPIVKGDAEGTPDGGLLAAGRGAKRVKPATPTLAETGDEPAGDGEHETVIEPVSVLVDVESESEPPSVEEPVAGDEPAAGPPAVVPVVGESADDDVAAGRQTSDELAEAITLPPEAPEAVAVGVAVELPSLAETPGWRPRRGR